MTSAPCHDATNCITFWQRAQPVAPGLLLRAPVNRYGLGQTQGEWELIVAALEEALDRERERRRKAEFEADELKVQLARGSGPGEASG